MIRSCAASTSWNSREGAANPGDCHAHVGRGEQGQIESGEPGLASGGLCRPPIDKTPIVMK
jgi:hypothetical protein